MNSSRVIKSSRVQRDHAIMITRPSNDEVAEGGFHSLASLWQSDDAELAAGLGQLAEERRLLHEEAQALKAESEAMIAEAKARAKQIEEEAQAKGLAEGKAQAEAEAKNQFLKIDALLTELEGERQRFHQQYEEDMLTLIKAMVDRVLFHEIKANPQAIELCLKKALTYVVENAKVVIRLHGQDLERLRQAAQERSELLAGYQKIDLVEDSSLAIGDASSTLASVRLTPVWNRARTRSSPLLTRSGKRLRLRQSPCRAERL